jgi:hypothetical protein
MTTNESLALAASLPIKRLAISYGPGGYFISELPFQEWELKDKRRYVLFEVDEFGEAKWRMPKRFRCLHKEIVYALDDNYPDWHDALSQTRYTVWQAGCLMAICRDKKSAVKIARKLLSRVPTYVPVTVVS